MGLLTGKSGVIVGASSGIGHAAAILFAEEGAQVAVVARRKEKLEKLVETITAKGGKAFAIQADVSVAADHERIVSETVAAFGRSHPIGRMGTPRETAELACFLVSDRAANITGQAILVDGGYAIGGQRAA